MSVHGLPETWPSGHQWVSLADYEQVTCDSCKNDPDWRVYNFVDTAIRALGKSASAKELLHHVMQHLSHGSVNPRNVQQRLRELGYV
jgi:hypothetical protein